MAVDENIHHRRKRRSTQFVELINNSNRNIKDDFDHNRMIS